MKKLARVLLLGRSMLSDLDDLRYHSSEHAGPECDFCEALTLDADGVDPGELVDRFEGAAGMLFFALEMSLAYLADNIAGLPAAPTCEKCGVRLVIDTDAMDLVCPDEDCQPIPYALARRSLAAV
jgi:hypothetical protein